MNETPRFIQGVFSFTGAGLARPVAIRPLASYKVPFDKRAQLVYLRAGNSTEELVYLALQRDKRPMRLFPIGAKDAIHVTLAIIEDIDPESEIEFMLGAPEGLEGAVLIDMGLLEI
jgi:hypothetical protein